MQLRNAVVLITGASRGIGRAVALAAARNGATVGLVARSAEGLAAVAEEVHAAGGTAATAAADVADRAQVRAAVDALTAALGPIDVVVANAGIGMYGSFLDVDLDAAERLVQVNLLGTIYTLQATVPAMAERRRGHVVTIGSIAGRIGAPFESIYSATKFGQVGMTESLAVELEPHGIGVSMVNPGVVATDFFAARGHTYDKDFPKPVSAEAVADAVIDCIVKGQPERIVPGWMRQAVMFRHLAPPLYRRGTKRTFAAELAAERARS